MSAVRTEAVESKYFLDLHVVAKINSHEVSMNLGCPQNLYKTCTILSYSFFLCNCKYETKKKIIKLNRGSILFRAENIKKGKTTKK